MHNSATSWCFSQQGNLFPKAPCFVYFNKPVTNSSMSSPWITAFLWARLKRFSRRPRGIEHQKGITSLESVENELSHKAGEKPVTNNFFYKSWEIPSCIPETETSASAQRCSRMSVLWHVLGFGVHGVQIFGWRPDMKSLVLKKARLKKPLLGSWVRKVSGVDRRENK